jgi:hypothetical protein
LATRARKADRNLQRRREAAGSSLRMDVHKTCILGCAYHRPQRRFVVGAVAQVWCGARSLVLYPRTTPKELREQTDGAEPLITNKVRLDAESQLRGVTTVLQTRFSSATELVNRSRLSLLIGEKSNLQRAFRRLFRTEYQTRPQPRMIAQG